jgi:uncharacterized protein YoaH (UPF0181 family)
MSEKKRYTCLTKEFWIKKGLSEDEAIQKVSEIQRKNSKKVNKENLFNPRLKESWIKKGLSEDEAIQKVSEIQVKSSNMRKEFWIKKGLSEDEAIQKVSEIQRKNSKKRKEYKKEDQNTNIEFYIKRKYPNALKSLQERQNTRSLEKYVERYGVEKGVLEYNKTIEKFKNSAWYSKTKEEQLELTLKRVKKTNFYSSASILVFEKIIENLHIPYKIRWKNNEHFIKYDSGIFFYDFCIPDINFIIEYNGIKFHPNKNKLSIEEFNDWKQLLSNTSANEIYEKDTLKYNVAKNNGYDIFYIWEDDNIELKINEMKNEIISRINQTTNRK